VFKLFCAGIPVTGAGIAIWCIVKKYRESKTDKGSIDDDGKKLELYASKVNPPLGVILVAEVALGRKYLLQWSNETKFIAKNNITIIQQGVICRFLARQYAPQLYGSTVNEMTKVDQSFFFGSRYFDYASAASTVHQTNGRHPFKSEVFGWREFDHGGFSLLGSFIFESKLAQHGR
jgi:hypothetical protein